jgi:hypothetical protein
MVKNGNLLMRPTRVDILPLDLRPASLDIQLSPRLSHRLTLSLLNEGR